jgi:hypothetical protein
MWKGHQTAMRNKFNTSLGYYTLLYSYNFNPIKNTHLRHVTVHYFSRIVQPEAVFFPYWTSKTFFFRIVHYVREVTRWCLSYEIRNVPFNIQFYITIILLEFFSQVWQNYLFVRKFKSEIFNPKLVSLMVKQ